MSRRIFAVVLALLCLAGALPSTAEAVVSAPVRSDRDHDDDDNHESYPFKAPSLAIKPNYCRSGLIDGTIEGAAAGTYVSVRLEFRLSSDLQKTIVIRKRADSDGEVEFKLRIPSGARSVVITATGVGIQAGEPFTLTSTLDLSTCKRPSGAHCSKSNVWSRALCSAEAARRS